MQRLIALTVFVALAVSSCVKDGNTVAVRRGPSLSDIRSCPHGGQVSRDVGWGDSRPWQGQCFGPPPNTQCCSHYADSKNVCRKNPKQTAAEKALRSCRKQSQEKKNKAKQRQSSQSSQSAALKKCRENANKPFSCKSVPNRKQTLKKLKKSYDTCCIRYNNLVKNRRRNRSFYEELLADEGYEVESSYQKRLGDTFQGYASEQGVVQPGGTKTPPKWFPPGFPNTSDYEKKHGYPQGHAVDKAVQKINAALKQCRAGNSKTDKSGKSNSKNAAALKKCQNNNSRDKKVALCRKNTALLDKAVADCKTKLSRCRSKVQEMTAKPKPKTSSGRKGYYY